MGSREIDLLSHGLSIFGHVFSLGLELLLEIGESWKGTQDTQDTVWCTIYVSIQLFYWVHNKEIHNKCSEIISCN